MVSRQNIPQRLKRLYYRLYRVLVRAWCLSSRFSDRLAVLPAGVGLPPPELRFRVAGTPSARSFLEVGESSGREIERCLEESGIRLGSLRRVLDFGVGCGRTVTWLSRRFPSVEFFGVDVDE